MKSELGLLISTILLISPGALHARHLTPDEALQTALSENYHTLRIISTTPFSDFSLEYTGPNEAVYVFQCSSGGFLVTAADSESPEILLGFSDNGYINATTLPEGLRCLIEEYSSGNYYVPQTRAGNKKIAPLCKTTWNQTVPYNYYCPKIGGKICYTGCVATGMAQIAKKWNYPSCGIGTASVDVAGTTYTFDYNSRPFEWNNMKNTLDYSDANAKAVGNLMYGCGVGAKMNYGVDASGTSLINAGTALIDYFRYDKSLFYARKAFHDIADWEKMIYGELSQGHPILYEGKMNNPGHAFVCDGYDGSSRYHINWGWGGNGDGYYLLTNLKPNNSSDPNFNYSGEQGALFNIMPAVAGSDYTPYFLGYGTFGPKSDKFEREQSVAFQFQPDKQGYGAYYSYSLKEIQFTDGVKLTEKSTGKVSYISSGTSQNLLPTYGVYNIYVPARDFPETGDFIVTPAIKYKDKWYDIHEEQSCRKDVNLTCTTRQLLFNGAMPDLYPELMINSVTVSGNEFTIGETVEIKLDIISKNKKYTGSLRPSLYSGDNRVFAFAFKYVEAPIENPASYVFSQLFDAEIPSGKYNLYIEDSSYNKIFGPIEVTVVKKEKIYPTIECVSINQQRYNGIPIEIESNSNFLYEVRLQAAEADYRGEIQPVILSLDDSSFYRNIGYPKSIELTVGSSVPYEFEGYFFGLEENDNYLIQLYDVSYNNKVPIGDPVSFIPVKAGLRVTSIELDSDKFIIGHEHKISIEYTARGKNGATGFLIPEFYKDNQRAFKFGNYFDGEADLGSVNTYEWIDKVPTYNVKPGVYDLYIDDISGNGFIYGPLSVTVAFTDIDPIMTTVDINYQTYDGHLAIVDPERSIAFWPTFRSDLGYYSADLQPFYYLESNPEEKHPFADPYSLNISEGSTERCYFTGVLDGIDNNTSEGIYLCIYNVSESPMKMIGTPVLLGTENYANLCSISELDAFDVQIFDLCGYKVDAPIVGNPYILRYPDGRTSKMIIRK